MIVDSRSRTGLTLVQLILLIAVTGLLAAILFPVFAQAREKARAISCLSNTKQAGLAWQMYSQDYDETVTPISRFGASRAAALAARGAVQAHAPPASCNSL